MGDNIPNKFDVDTSKMRMILSDKNIPSGAKVVLFNLIYRLGRKNYAFPSQRRISEDVGLSERQVRNHLKLLKGLNIIRWERGVLNPLTKKVANVNSYNLSNMLTEKTQ